MKLVIITSLCATLFFSCSKNGYEQSPILEKIVQTTQNTRVVNTSTVIDFKLVALQQPDAVIKQSALSERAQLLASVDQILETTAGQWEFYSNFKLLFTLVSPDRQDMQAINGQEHLFNTITLHTNPETKLADAVRFSISDCQYASTDMCDAVDAIIYVHTLNGTPRADQDQDQDQSQDKDQD